MPPGAPAGIALPDTMPTTTSFKSTGCVTGFRVTPGTKSAPEAAVNTTGEPIAARPDETPSAVASLSVRSTSPALSERGRRPALRTGRALDDPMGASETSAPDDGAAGPDETVGVPD